MMGSMALSADSRASDSRAYLSRFTQRAVTREQEGARRHGLLGQDPYKPHDSGPPRDNHHYGNQGEGEPAEHGRRNLAHLNKLQPL